MGALVATAPRGQVAFYCVEADLPIGMLIGLLDLNKLTACGALEKAVPLLDMQ